jgi:hypothetical protein
MAKTKKEKLNEVLTGLMQVWQTNCLWKGIISKLIVLY